MAKKQAQAKEIDKRIERAYYASCHGVQINILDIGKVFAEGRKLVAAGFDEDALRTSLRSFVDRLVSQY